MANLACLELHPHPVRADDLDHPDELRIDLDPVPGVEWSQIREVAGIVRATLDDVGLVGWPKTSGSRGMHIYVRIERRWTFDEVRRAALALAREVERRAPGSRDEQMVEGGTSGRVPRLQPEREGPNGRRGVLGQADARCARVRAADLGRDRRLRTGRFHAEARCRRASRGSGTVTPAWTDTPCSLDALLELSARQEREGLGDAPWPPHYRKQPGEAPRVAPSRRRTPTHPLVEIGRAREKADALAGFERWKARHPEAGAHLKPADVLVDALRGRFRTWTRVRVNLQHVPEALRPAQEPLDPDENMADEWNGVSDPGRRAEHLLELVRGRDLELVVAAVDRPFVGTPTLEDGRVTESRALHVIVFHLADALDAKRLPREIFARAPTALAARHARHLALVPRPTPAMDDRRALLHATAPAPPRAACASAIVNDEVTPT